MSEPTKSIAFHFASGRVFTVDAPAGIGSPEEHAEKLCNVISDKTKFLTVGPHLVFLRNLERIEMKS